MRTYVYRLFLILFTSLFLASCATTNKKIENPKEEKIEKNICEEKVKEKIIIKEIIKKSPPKIIFKEKCQYPKTVIGEKEYVYIPLLQATYKARIDTGATTSSIHAKDIKEFERDGEKWVSFKLIKNKDEIDFKLPIERIIKVKRHGTTNQKRYVVKMRLTIGKITQLIDVSLTNREKFNYWVLIGRNFLNGFAIVDVSRKFTSTPKKEEE